MIWEDTTSYSQHEPRNPSCWSVRLDEDLELTVMWSRYEYWTVSLKIPGHYLINAMELKGLDKSQEDSAKRLALMTAINYMDSRMLSWSKAIPKIALFLAELVKKEMDNLMKAKDAT